MGAQGRGGRGGASRRRSPSVVVSVVVSAAVAPAPCSGAREEDVAPLGGSREAPPLGRPRGTQQPASPSADLVWEA